MTVREKRKGVIEKEEAALNLFIFHTVLHNYIQFLLIFR